MLTHSICNEIAPPFGDYSHAVEVPPGARVLHLAGQVGARRDGTIPPDLEEEVTLLFENIAKVLEFHGMSMADLVKINYFVASKDHLAVLRTVRNRFLRKPYPAASLIVAQALGRPEWRVEIDCVAAKNTPG